MEEIRGLFGGLIAFLIGMVAAAVAGRWVIGPLHRAAEERDYRIQFTVADVLCLFFAMQLVLGMVGWAARFNAFQNVLVYVFYFVIVGFAWWQFVRMLSRAGVRVVWQRCFLMLIVVPITLIGAFAVAFAPFAAIDLFMRQPSALGDIAILLAAIPLPGVIYWLGRFTRAVVASATKE